MSISTRTTGRAKRIIKGLLYLDMGLRACDGLKILEGPFITRYIEKQLSGFSQGYLHISTLFSEGMPPLRGCVKLLKGILIILVMLNLKLCKIEG